MATDGQPAPLVCFKCKGGLMREAVRDTPEGTREHRIRCMRPGCNFERPADTYLAQLTASVQPKV